jgi:lipoprotein signal peptidase
VVLVLRSGRGRWPAAIALVVVVVVVGVDQATKSWAWRHVAATINDGGDVLVGPMVGRLYAEPLTGALLDALGAAVLGLAAYKVMRGRRPILVRVPGMLAIAGWASNLLDRLGLHALTAPGSVRGAIDFIPVGDYYYNVADLFIIAATPLFLLAIGVGLGHRTVALDGHLRGEHVGREDLRWHGQQPVGVGHQRLGDRAVDMRLAGVLVRERVDDPERRGVGP